MRPLMSAIATMAMMFVASQAFAQSYTYDEFGRVKSVTTGSTVTNYCYDKADNRYADTTSAGGTACAATATNHAPTCTNSTTTMGGIPSYATASVTVTAAMVLSQCSDPDGDTLTVTSPALPVTLTINAGQGRSVDFTVSDGKGGTASAYRLYVRPS